MDSSTHDQGPQHVAPAEANGGAATSGLTDELMRRLSLREAAAAQPVPGLPSSPTVDHRDISRHPRLFSEERHDGGEDAQEHAPTDAAGLVLKWRQKEKLKTTAVALVLCLNIGVDPPDVIKISPCARLECWVDPNSMQPAKALEAIGKNLQAQYERWQPKAKYKMHLDPTVDDVKKLAQTSRKNAKNERVLFHYNGHGVPRPTANGELWVFNARYTQYIPLSVYELHSWLGTPAIYVLDCSSAAIVINSFKALMDQRALELRNMAAAQGYGGMAAPPGAAADPMREIIVLAACGASEVLPQSAELPADVFTACLTTPIKVALRWFASRSLLRHDGITKELIDKIPGRQTDRKTPLGELNWIFTAITDTIAWNVLPRALFQKLFRSDLLVASLFRNFLLAERIMAAVGCTPQSLPRLPPTHQHPMWQAWDMAAEMCLMQLPTLLSDPAAEFQPSPFFSEQLTAFELWLAAGSRDRSPPEQLPIVLQVLLSQVHRLRALVLLGRFLDMGSWAVDLALSVGIFPYVLKLLQTTSQDLRATLVFIWAKILALDKSCQVDLVKDNGQTYFIRYLDSSEAGVEPTSRAQAAFVLSVICDGHPKGQALCASNGLLTVLLRWLRTYFPPQVTYPSQGHVLLLKWLCLCLGKLCQDSPEISLMAIREGAADLLVALIGVAQPEVRAAAVFGLGCLVHAPGAAPAGADMGSHMVPPLEDRLPAEQLIANAVRQAQVVYDPSVLVRGELAVLYARYVRGHAAQVQEALSLQQRRLQEFARQHMPASATNSMSLDATHTSTDGEARSGAWRAGTEGADQSGSTSSLPRPARTVSDHENSHPPSYQSHHSHPSSGAGAGPLNSGSSAGTDRGVDRPSSAPLPGLMGQAGPAAAGLGGRTAPIYTAMVEAIQLLALDPSPKAAKLGRQVLRIAQCELSFMPTAISSGTASHMASSGTQSPHHPSAAAGALGSFAQKLRRPTWASSARSSMPPGAASGGAGQQQPSLPRHSMGAVGTGGPSNHTAPTTPGASTPGAGASMGGAGPAGHMQTDGGLPTLLDMHSQHSMPSTPSRSSSPGSPIKDLGFSRPPYVLTCWPDLDAWSSRASTYYSSLGPTGMGSAPPQLGTAQSTLTSASAVAGTGGMQHAMSAAGRSSTASQLLLPPDMATMRGAHAGAPGHPALHAGPGAGLPPEPLPWSRVYRMSCDAFARPLLDPGAGAWRDGAASAPHWTAPVDPKRRAQRLDAIHSQIARCRALTQPKLREQVFSVDTQGEGLARLCFHPYHNLLVCADMLGYIRVMPYDTPSAAAKALQTFHVSNGAPLGDSRVHPTTITHMQHITEADGPLLLAGAADGAVRVWRQHSIMGGTAGLATAMQAVTINLPPGPGRSTCYAWHGARCQLYAAGGSHPEMVYCWDMHHEMCCNMLSMSMSNSTASSGSNGPYVDGVHLGVADPHLLLAACSDTTLRLFDVRAPRGPALVLAPFKCHIAGVALEPAGRPGMIVAASEKGELVLLDSRAALGSTAALMSAGAPPPALAELSAAATSKTVAAHSKGGVSCLVSHTVAPLLATGTTNQVVKVWTDQCEPVGAIRAHSSGPAVPATRGAAGCVTCMAWHPYLPLLAAGGYDSIATVYAIDQAPSKASASGSSAYAV